MTAIRKKHDYRVELIGHASLRVHANGKTLLTDPWYVDPINCNSIFHWPPLTHGIEEIAAETDAIYLSHIHPDHFDPRTLARFPRTIPIYIGEYSKKFFRDEIRSLGFQVHEIPFQQPTRVPSTDFTIAILESDYGESAAYDSSLVVQTPQFTLFDNNDCYLHEAKYRWVAERYRIDYAFLGYSPASYYPICFEFEGMEKSRLLTQAAETHYSAFLKACEILSPRVSVPFAMGIRFLHPSMLWQNASFNSPREAIRRVSSVGKHGEVLSPGDRILPNDQISRKNPLLAESQEPKQLEMYAREMQASIQRIWDSESPARPDLLSRFREYIEGLWQRSLSEFPEVRQDVIAYEIEGTQAGSFHFDFSRDPFDIFLPGLPEHFDMRYRYPDRILQLVLDKKIDWDELHFSNRVSVKQNRYASRFYAMLRSADGLAS